MDSAIVAAASSLIGVAVGVIAQQIQAGRTRKWQQFDARQAEKRTLYAAFIKVADSVVRVAIESKNGGWRESRNGRKRVEPELDRLFALYSEIEMVSGGAAAKSAHNLTGYLFEFTRLTSINHKWAQEAANFRLATAEILKADLEGQTKKLDEYWETLEEAQPTREELAQAIKAMGEIMANPPTKA
jgi:hypothetical protein